MRNQGIWTSVLGCLAAWACVLNVQANPPARTKLMNVFASPIFVTFAPGDTDHVFVCERAGAIRVMNTSTGAITPGSFLDISPQVSLESDNGLLGLAFDPDYTTNGFFYINYRHVDGNLVLARYHATPGSFTADADSAYTILRYPRPLGHNGGWIGFSPINGYLYITSGDGDPGSTPDFANRAQTIVDQRMGKILRIDPRSDDFPGDPDRNYHIPPTNPFVGVVGDDEIWAYGLRNPWRASFDRVTGDLYFGDVGFNSWEEVDIEPANTPGGRNYGWPCTEGTHCTESTSCTCNDPSLTSPVYDYEHVAGGSVTGGCLYRGAAIPEFQGLYFFGDFIRAKIWSFRPTAGGGGFTEFADRTAEMIPPTSSAVIPWIATFGEDSAGELYVCNIFGGRVYKIVPYPCLPIIDTNPVAQSRVEGTTVTLTVAGVGADPLTFRWRKGEMDLEDGDHIHGSHTTTLTISSALVSDTGSYDVVLTSPCGSIDSSNVLVRVYPCPNADFDGSGTVAVADIFAFLGAWFASDPSADTDQSGHVTVSDIFLFLGVWFSGC